MTRHVDSRRQPSCERCRRGEWDMWAGCVVSQRPKGNRQLWTTCAKVRRERREGGGLSKEMGGGARSCLLRSFPTLPSPQVFSLLTDSDYWSSVLNDPHLFLFDVFGFLLRLLVSCLWRLPNWQAWLKSVLALSSSVILFCGMTVKQNDYAVLHLHYRNRKTPVSQQKMAHCSIMIARIQFWKLFSPSIDRVQ